MSQKNVCPFCGAEHVLSPEERRRPGPNLRALLAEREISLADFASQLWPEQDRVAALANLRKYTHAEKAVSPGLKMLLQWAVLLDVEPRRFYEAPPSLSPWRNASLPCTKRVRMYFDGNPKAEAVPEQLAEELSAEPDKLKYVLARYVSSGALTRTVDGAYRRVLRRPWNAEAE